ncbi:MAG: IclR family transcriptional regulator [Candidatus Promineifilaceae bacterium]|nr:IclR family transcriptional regulator [Candidatus Promineifilaceae bacterium]
MSSEIKPYPGTQSVIRALTLLKAFDSEHPEWTLSQLARKVNLNKTTTYRLLSALESEGLIARNDTGDGYILGPEIVVLGGHALRSNNLRTVSRPELEQLAAITGETASLEILAGNKMLIIDEVVGDHLVSGVRSIGTRWPVHGASTGLALMAYWSDDELARFLRNPLDHITENTPSDPQELRRLLDQVAKQGYAVADEMLEIGLVAIGAPLIDDNGCVAGAISIYGPKSRINHQRIKEIGLQVHEAALRISARLGYLPGRSSRKVLMNLY